MRFVIRFAVFFFIVFWYYSVFIWYFVDEVRPICLPSGQQLNETFAGQTMDVAGWGKTETKSASEVIMKLMVSNKTYLTNVMLLLNCSTSRIFPIFSI